MKEMFETFDRDIGSPQPHYVYLLPKDFFVVGKESDRVEDRIIVGENYSKLFGKIWCHDSQSAITLREASDKNYKCRVRDDEIFRYIMVNHCELWFHDGGYCLGVGDDYDDKRISIEIPHITDFEKILHPYSDHESDIPYQKFLKEKIGFHSSRTYLQTGTKPILRLSIRVEELYNDAVESILSSHGVFFEHYNLGDKFYCAEFTQNLDVLSGCLKIMGAEMKHGSLIVDKLYNGNELLEVVEKIYGS